MVGTELQFFNIFESPEQNLAMDELADRINKIESALSEGGLTGGAGGTTIVTHDLTTPSAEVDPATLPSLFNDSGDVVERGNLFGYDHNATGAKLTLAIADSTYFMALGVAMTTAGVDEHFRFVGSGVRVPVILESASIVSTRGQYGWLSGSVAGRATNVMPSYKQMVGQFTDDPDEEGRAMMTLLLQDRIGR